MYSGPYGFPNAAGQPFNGAAPPQQNPHMQQGNSPTQPHMMYNPQQFPMGAQGGMMPGGANPNMMPGAVPGAGMMQNAGMPINGQMGYQTPYSGSPYGPGVQPSASGQGQMPSNYMMAGPMGGYPMNQAGGKPQQQQQMMSRGQAPQQQQQQQQQQNPAGMPMSTPQRPFHQGQGSPISAMTPQQAQFAASQASQSPSLPQAGSNMQPQSATSATPQTPTFPSAGPGMMANGASSGSTPMSPGTESKDAERFQLLLDIDHELLYEAVQLQNTKAELKKAAAASGTPEGGNKGPTAESAEDMLIQQDYTQCMRRLHANLAFLAALADKKGNVTVPASPAFMTPPPLNLTIKMRGANPVPEAREKHPDQNADRAERAKQLRDMYAKLHELFPGVDPNLEPAFPAAAGGGGGQGQGAGGGQGQRMMGAAAAGGSAEASPASGGQQRTPQMAASAPPSALA